ncbi:MAG: undecaprenyldiphospho-muramoylpentapeptide beta-N-acetylglucosaminyltransferase [Deltaproteobacteria bacterium]|nr:undecaprenyldiphospho-muramoylpentapeptide beta-N-acetylglucosaminyltransferase [Deltaproteobacteria bacterium]MCB9787857.1 undecaprenyldiphospho-muramoylpentapeptide beta-N-acetylglucosaminyltransferase [Deltaproteobacteria bacterium]
MIRRALIAGGKTGGHLYPGVAIAEELRRRQPDARVTFVGTAEGIEARVLPPLGWTLLTISASRLAGGGLLDRLRGLARVPVAMFQSWRHLRHERPQVVIGVGGYASGPVLLTAWLCRYPTAIQEQNALPGFTNRVLGRFARRIYLGFDAAAARFGGRPTLATGNPIRRALVEALASATSTREASGHALRVLVFGGSQGARFLNERAPALLASLHAAHPELALTVTHQTGVADEAATRARYAATPLADAARVLPYIDDMPAAYAAADVAICRAGALTIAELTAVGLPSVLVPFPFAAGNHQEANARVIADAGAGLLVRQGEWDEAAVRDWLYDVATTPGRLRERSERARSLARPDAASALVDDLEVLAA